MSRETPASTEARQQALNAACARTLAGQADLVLVDSHCALRGNADATACHIRYRLPETARQNRPRALGGSLFDALEEARAEALGARWLAGIASNLALRPALPANPRDRLRAWAYGIFLGQSTSCPEEVAKALSLLARHIDDPIEFANRASSLALALEKKFPATSSLDPSGPDPNSVPAADEEFSGENSQVEGNEEDSDGEPQVAESPRDSIPGTAPPPLPEVLMRNYQVYDSSHDRVVDARKLVDAAELNRLRLRLDGELLPYRGLVTRLAHRLQRLLLARQRRNWSLDQEEGLLDASRLARLVAAPNRTEIFRIEEEGLFPQTCVTLLFDNSGSMRGHPITVAALCADILARALERCGIKVEILGFTTADWEGGTPAERWAQAGSPPSPGRLNSLRHIVYKSMDTPWRRARLSLGLMLKEDLLKENIDGEALWWACQRLTGRAEARRLLIVVSDGAPMDKATLTANPRSYLDQHLQQVVSWVEKNTDIQLRAIGIGHQIGRYYRNSISLRQVDDLGTTLANHLGAWLD